MVLKENEVLFYYELVKVSGGRNILRNGYQCGIVSYIPKKQGDKILYWNIKGKINHLGLELVFSSIDFSNIVLRSPSRKPSRYRFKERTYKILRG